jgi:hypothetical protein
MKIYQNMGKKLGSNNLTATFVYIKLARMK